MVDARRFVTFQTTNCIRVEYERERKERERWRHLHSTSRLRGEMIMEPIDIATFVWLGGLLILALFCLAKGLFKWDQKSMSDVLDARNLLWEREVLIYCYGKIVRQSNGIISDAEELPIHTILIQLEERWFHFEQEDLQTYL